MENPYKPREISNEYYYRLEEFIQKLKIWLRSRTIGNGVKILKKRKKFLEKIDCNL